MDIIGRNAEIEVLASCLQANESKLVAVYGRRRVGKTFLVRQYFQTYLAFDIAGLHNGNMNDQLTHFSGYLTALGHKPAQQNKPTTWMAAFAMLAKYIDGIKTKKKKVIFIDELPWFDTPRSKFLMAFENFWNGYCARRNDVVVVICGSAASWMIKKIMRNRGGLHNRVSEKIKLQPFNLHETALFLNAKGIKWSQYDITQLYMAAGGIPFYLNAVKKGESVTQFIDRACFASTGILHKEFQELYASLFDNSHLHYTIINALAKVKSGITRTELIAKTKITSGGTFTSVMDELLESGFVTKFLPFDNNINLALYRLTDHFTLFYLKFMHNAKTSGAGTWGIKAVGQSWQSWCGFAFESVCMQHIAQIKKALKITAIYTEESSWKGSYEGNAAQVDLIINRADRIIHLCEAKFANNIFVITKAYAKELQNKMGIFAMQPPCKNKNIFLTMLTVRGIQDNAYAKELVQNQVVLNDLFAAL